MVNGNESVSTALATVGTVCWCIQLIPQLIRNWYVRDCEGVPPVMFFLFAISGIPFAVYFIDQDANQVFMVQPHLFAFFSFCAFWQSLYYRPVSYSIRKATLILLVVLAVCVGIEAGCIFSLRHLYRKGIHWPNLIPGIVASILLAMGLLLPYWELSTRGGQVVGINFLFLTLDSAGAILSMIGIALQPGNIDILGLVLYSIVFVLECGIFFAHLGWMVWTRGNEISSIQIETGESRITGNSPKSQRLRDWATKSIVIPLHAFISKIFSGASLPTTDPIIST